LLFKDNFLYSSRYFVIVDFTELTKLDLTGSKIKERDIMNSNNSESERSICKELCKESHACLRFSKGLTICPYPIGGQCQCFFFIPTEHHINLSDFGVI